MDKMREEFEAWWISKNPTHTGIGSHWYENGYWVNSNSIYSGVELQWDAWKASRAALCVELPETPEFNAEDEPEIAYEWAVNDLKDRLELAGVSFI